MTIDQFMRTIKVGKVCNVGSTGKPMLRKVKSAKVVRERGKDWFMWTWEIGGETPHGTPDCGFAGLAIEYHRALGDLA